MTYYHGERASLLQRKSFLNVDDLSKSELDGLYKANPTKYVSITKWTIQKYLEACLREDGQFRPFFDKFAPFTGGFVVNENYEGDPHKRHIQIARYYSQARAMPPQIFIQDTGYNYVPASLGGLTAGWNERDKQGNQIVRVMDVIPVPLEITISGLDEEFVDSMEGFFSAAFGQYQKFLCGWVLKPAKSQHNSGAYWEVRIPQTHTVGPKTSQGIRGDPENQVWSVTATVEFEFENSTYITYRAKPEGDFRPPEFEVFVPSRITTHDVVPINFLDMPYPFRIYSSDLRVALIEQRQTSYFIRPKRVGTFTLIVAKPGSTEGEMTTVAEKEITIVPR